MLGPWESSCFGGIFRASGCKGASSANPSCFTFWAMVPVSGLVTFGPFENLYVWGQWSYCYAKCSWVSGWITEPLVMCLAASIWVNTRTGHRPVMSVLFYWQLSPVTTSSPHCNAWAWQKPPLGSQRSERTRPYCYTAGDCLDSWKGAVLCHLPTEPQKRSQF